MAFVAASILFVSLALCSLAEARPILQAASVDWCPNPPSTRDITEVLSRFSTPWGVFIRGNPGVLTRLLCGGRVPLTNEDGTLRQDATEMVPLLVHITTNASRYNNIEVEDSLIVPFLSASDPERPAMDQASSLPRCTPNQLQGFADPSPRPLLTVTTVKRPPGKPDYIHTTIASLTLSGALTSQDTLHVFEGSEDAEYLRNIYGHHGHIRVEPMQPSDFAVASRSPVTWRQCLNVLRCLYLANDTLERSQEDHLERSPEGSARVTYQTSPDGTSTGSPLLERSHEPSGERGLVVLEDDVVLVDDFVGHLNTVLADISRLHEGCFVLSLYSTYEFQTPEILDPKSLCWHPSSLFAHYDDLRPYVFYGAQGMYFPPCAVPIFLIALSQWLKEILLSPPGPFHRLGWDSAVAYLSSHTKVPLLFSTFSLVQHIGMSSSITVDNTLFHCSPNFGLRT